MIHTYPEGYRPLNYCRSCGRDFAGVAYFDQHRIGTHDYTYSEGLVMRPSRTDGRRCMNTEEMFNAGLRFLTNEYMGDSKRHRSRAGAGVEMWGDPNAPARLASVQRNRQEAQTPQTDSRPTPTPQRGS